MIYLLEIILYEYTQMIELSVRQPLEPNQPNVPLRSTQNRNTPWESCHQYRDIQDKIKRSKAMIIFSIWYESYV